MNGKGNKNSGADSKQDIFAIASILREGEAIRDMYVDGLKTKIKETLAEIAGLTKAYNSMNAKLESATRELLRVFDCKDVEAVWKLAESASFLDSNLPSQNRIEALESYSSAKDCVEKQKALLDQAEDSLFQFKQELARMTSTKHKAG